MRNAFCIRKIITSLCSAINTLALREQEIPHSVRREIQAQVLAFWIEHIPRVKNKLHSLTPCEWRATKRSHSSFLTHHSSFPKNALVWMRCDAKVKMTRRECTWRTWPSGVFSFAMQVAKITRFYVLFRIFNSLIFSFSSSSSVSSRRFSFCSDSSR